MLKTKTCTENTFGSWESKIVKKKNRARFAENVTILLKTKAKKGLEEFKKKEK